MVSPEAVITSLYILVGWSTISTVMLVLARRDVKLGLQKWLMFKLRKQPIKLRYHGPDKNVTEYIIATKGKGEILTINDKRLLVIKTQNGSTFFLDEEAIRRCDDGVNEISFNYKSIMPLNPDQSEAEAEKSRADLIARIRTEKEKAAQKPADGYQGVEMEALAQYTDPRRLNRLIEYIKLAAKTEALLKATDMEKYVKWTLILTVGALFVSGLIWWTLDGKMLPMLQNIMGAVQGVGTQVLNIG